MEDGIEQNRSMFLNRMEKMEKYMFMYSPDKESVKKENFVTFDAKVAIEFCIENKCKIEIFYLNPLFGNYLSTNAFITPPQ
jgi:hypothetical protein